MGNLTVKIIVDPKFGDRLNSAAERGPVWIAQTPVNRAAAARWWGANSPPAEGRGVTTFLVEVGAPERWFLDVLGTVDMHYGGYGPDEREYDAIEVWGVEATPEIRAAVTELGFGQIESRSDGFRAGRSVPAA